MVSKELIATMYRSNDDTFESEIQELNEVLKELEINCEVISESSADGETLMFKKVEL